MESLHLEVTAETDGALTLTNLPIRAGESVEVIIQFHGSRDPARDRYPLRGTILQYDDPAEPVANSDWEALP